MPLLADWTTGETLDLQSLLPLLRKTTVQWGKEVERMTALADGPQKVRFEKHSAF